MIPARTFALTLAERLSPGTQLEVDRETMHEIEDAPYGWSKAEWILEFIPGSAYEFMAWENGEKARWVFRRLQKPLTGGLRSYVSPDRREFFTKRADGLWEPLTGYQPNAFRCCTCTEIPYGQICEVHGQQPGSAEDISTISFIQEIRDMAEKLKAMGETPNKVKVRQDIVDNPARLAIFKAECERLGIQYEIIPKKI